MTQAGSVAERRRLIDTAVADGCRAMIERLVTDAMPDTRTLEERRRLLEPDEEMPDEWPHRDEGNTINPSRSGRVAAIIQEDYHPRGRHGICLVQKVARRVGWD